MHSFSRVVQKKKVLRSEQGLCDINKAILAKVSYIIEIIKNVTNVI